MESQVASNTIDYNSNNDSSYIKIQPFFPQNIGNSRTGNQHSIAVAEISLPNRFNHSYYSPDPLPQPSRKNPHPSLRTRTAAITHQPSLQYLLPRNTKVSLHLLRSWPAEYEAEECCFEIWGFPVMRQQQRLLGTGLFFVGSGAAT